MIVVVILLLRLVCFDLQADHVRLNLLKLLDHDYAELAGRSAINGRCLIRLYAITAFILLFCQMFRPD